MKHNLSAFAQLLYYAGLHKAQLFLAILCSSLNALCNILPEVFAGLAIDVVLQKNQSSIAVFFNEPRVMPQLYIIGALTIFVCVLESLFEYCYLLLWKGFGEQVQYDLRVQMYSQICQLEMAFHENETTGSILSILNEDVGELDRLLKETINRLIQLVVSTLCIWLIFVYLAPFVAVLALIPIPFVLIISFYFHHKLAPIYKKAREHSGQLNGRIANTLMGIAEIKSYTAEEY